MVTAVRKQSPEDRFLAPDKAQHFMFSIIATVFTSQMLERKAGTGHRNSLQMAGGVTLTLGIGKEIRDSRQPRNHFSWKDLLADVAGIAVGLVLANQP